MHLSKKVVLVTEANTKNSIVIQSELSVRSDVHLIAQSEGSNAIAKSWNYCDEYLNVSLADVLQSIEVDFVVPVGGKSVKYISKYYPQKALVSKHLSVLKALDKSNYFWIQKLGVKIPREISLTELLDKSSQGQELKYVLKSSDESKNKYEPVYITSMLNSTQIETLVESKGGDNEVIIQEYIEGEGRGFFGLCLNGVICDFYMHRRLRQIPHTGGSSTACSSVYDLELLNQSKRIIEALSWTGPIMIEYKYNIQLRNYTLIELNPKYWGSLELASKLGKQWGLSSYEYFVYEKPILNESYETGVKFYWPLDGDWVSIVKSGELRELRSYFKSDYSLPRENFKSLIFKILWTLLKIIR